MVPTADTQPRVFPDIGVERGIAGKRTAEMMIEPSLIDEHWNLHVGRNLFEQPPETFIPVGISPFWMTDPVAIPVETASPHILIHGHLRQMQRGREIVGVNGMPGVLHGPCSKHVATE